MLVYVCFTFEWILFYFLFVLYYYIVYFIIVFSIIMLQHAGRCPISYYPMHMHRFSCGGKKGRSKETSKPTSYHSKYNGLYRAIGITCYRNIACIIIIIINTYDDYLLSIRSHTVTIELTCCFVKIQMKISRGFSRVITIHGYKIWNLSNMEFNGNNSNFFYISMI